MKDADIVLAIDGDAVGQGGGIKGETLVDANFRCQRDGRAIKDGVEGEAAACRGRGDDFAKRASAMIVGAEDYISASKLQSSQVDGPIENSWESGEVQRFKVEGIFSGIDGWGAGGELKVTSCRGSGGWINGIEEKWIVCGVSAIEIVVTNRVESLNEAVKEGGCSGCRIGDR